MGQLAASAAAQTLILHWNGTRWRRVASPQPGNAGSLFGVGARSAASAWAVGTTSQGPGGKSLILRWNGTRWRRVASPSQGGSAAENVLESVTGPAAGSAWAVGVVQTGNLQQTIILRWTGTRWAHVPSPSPGSTQTILFSVDASSARNVWAVGGFDTTDGTTRAFAVHCC
jgi:hypothetical protein